MIEILGMTIWIGILFRLLNYILQRAKPNFLPVLFGTNLLLAVIFGLTKIKIFIFTCNIVRKPALLKTFHKSLKGRQCETFKEERAKPFYPDNNVSYKKCMDRIFPKKPFRSLDANSKWSTFKSVSVPRTVDKYTNCVVFQRGIRYYDL